MLSSRGCRRRARPSHPPSSPRMGSEDFRLTVTVSLRLTRLVEVAKERASEPLPPWYCTFALPRAPMECLVAALPLESTRNSARTMVSGTAAATTSAPGCGRVPPTRASCTVLVTTRARPATPTSRRQRAARPTGCGTLAARPSCAICGDRVPPIGRSMVARVPATRRRAVGPWRRAVGPWRRTVAPLGRRRRKPTVQARRRRLPHSWRSVREGANWRCPTRRSSPAGCRHRRTLSKLPSACAVNQWRHARRDSSKWSGQPAASAASSPRMRISRRRGTSGGAPTGSARPTSPSSLSAPRLALESSCTSL